MFYLQEEALHEVVSVEEALAYAKARGWEVEAVRACEIKPSDGCDSIWAILLARRVYYSEIALRIQHVQSRLHDTHIVRKDPSNCPDCHGTGVVRLGSCMVACAGEVRRMPMTEAIALGVLSEEDLFWEGPDKEEKVFYLQEEALHEVVSVEEALGYAKARGWEVEAVRACEMRSSDGYDSVQAILLARRVYYSEIALRIQHVQSRLRGTCVVWEHLSSCPECHGTGVVELPDCQYACVGKSRVVPMAEAIALGEMSEEQLFWEYLDRVKQDATA